MSQAPPTRRFPPPVAGPSPVNVLVSCLTLLALLLMANYLRQPAFQTVQLGPTRPQLSTLTGQCSIVDQPGESDSFLRPGEQPLQLVKGLIEEYRLACPRLDVEYVDYVRWPDRGALSKPIQTLIRVGQGLVIFESGGRPPRIVYDKELFRV